MNIVGTTETKQVHSCIWNQKTFKQEMVIIQEVDARPTNSFVGGLCCINNYLYIRALYHYKAKDKVAVLMQVWFV